MKAGQYMLNIEKETLVMGILNLTPDSFSDGGKFTRLEEAVTRVKEMIAEGADIIDVGGESTRPGHHPVDQEEEIARVIPVIQRLSQEISVPISIDTYKEEVARQAVEAGASIINDVWGAKREPGIAKVAAHYGVPIIVMHNRVDSHYESFEQEVLYELYESIAICREAGVANNQIILDPGIGFAKDVQQNIQMMQLLDRVVSLGFPVLLGTSRKSLIGHVLDLPVDERLEGSLATVSYGIQKGCHIVRVHDVKETKRTVKMMDVLTGKREWHG
ncbi:dihydropteroate synthase [Bacillus coahuilensis p1.1.43]|uniref:Dihydropteroate synthase n=1 Tax=Bacillus coahuilensis p1.1.43 TaxID=1150625 RepID=A0A147K4T5_9BACI|nr:dihydropteroate synthase [Bacillus coahuilensis]KUP04542.1 dihydropteroate synthase [Bacillus coahuilensis p1.1.43]